MSFLKFFTRHQLIPKTIICFQEGYSKALFKNDLLSGITVGIIALPLAMAFAIGSGVAPERGLFTAIIAGFLISLLGGSRVQIGGPTGAYVILVYAIVEKHGYEGLVVATLLAGIILILLGFARCGILIRFIPYPVTTGFTSGIATVIAVGQIKDFFGLSIHEPSAEFVHRIEQYISSIHTFNPAACGVALLALAIIIACKKYTPKIPGTIIALVITTIVCSFFTIPIATIETQFGSIPQSLPLPHFPSFNLDLLQDVFPDAIAIALLGGIESLLSAVVADGMTGFRHNSNCELVGQGVANIGSALCGGIPATGAIARTTVNVQMQAKTPVAGIIHALTLLVLMIAFAPLAGKIPLATLAAILVFVAWNMSELDHCKDLITGPKSDLIVFAITYLLTVFIDLTVAVQAGVILAAFLFLKHLSEKTTIKTYTLLNQETPKDTPLPSIPPGVEVFEIEGPFFFGVTELLNEALKLKTPPPKIFILRLRSVPLIDASGIQAIKNFYNRCTSKGITFLLCEPSKDITTTLSQSNVTSLLGKDKIFPTLHNALAYAQNAMQ